MGQPAGTVYWVALEGDDRDPGTAEKPWRRLQWAMTRPFLRGGDTIRVRGGVYGGGDEDALIRPVASGEAGRPVTVMAEPGEKVVLSGRRPVLGWQTSGSSPALYYHEYPEPAGYPWEHPFQVVQDGRLVYRVASLEGVDRPGRCYVDTAGRRIWLRTSDGRPPGEHRIEYGAAASGIEFRGVAYWRLTGFALTGFRATGVMIANGGKGIEIDHMDIGFIGAHRPGADMTNGYAVAVYESGGENRIHHNQLHHTLAEAVHISQTAGPGDLWEDNEIHHSGGPEWLAEGTDSKRLFGPGMILRASGTTVARNRIYANGYHGLILESDLLGREGAASPSGNVVESNWLAWNGGNGIHGDGKNGVTASAGNVIRLNLLERNNQGRPGSDGDAELRLAGNLSGTAVTSNTVYAEQANGVLLATGRVRLAGNIVVHAARERRTWALRVIEPAPEVILDANNWYRVGGGAPVSWNGTEYGSLEEFRRQTGQERRGWSVDPRFVASETGCFWLRAVSPVIGLGAFPYRPLLEASPGEVHFVAVAGGRNPVEQSVAVASASGAPLGWTARAGEKWLKIAAGPGRVAVGVDARGVTAGPQDGTVEITPALAGEAPVVVRVKVSVVPSPVRRR